VGSHQPITVILPTRNRPALLVGTISSLIGEISPKSELLIFDSSSHAITKIPEVAIYLRLLRERNVKVRVIPGPFSHGKAVAEGLRLARYETIMIVNDDCYLENGSVSKLIQSLSRLEVGAVEAMQSEPGTKPRSIIPIPFNKLDRTPESWGHWNRYQVDTELDVDTLGGFFVIKKSVLKKKDLKTLALKFSRQGEMGYDRYLSSAVRKMGFRIIARTGANIRHMTSPAIPSNYNYRSWLRIRRRSKLESSNPY
jgi:glycosyltransferase involved in cell wall biosynthesis